MVPVTSCNQDLSPRNSWKKNWLIRFEPSSHITQKWGETRQKVGASPVSQEATTFSRSHRVHHVARKNRNGYHPITLAKGKMD